VSNGNAAERFIDVPGPVRDSEALDEAKLRSYLEEALPEMSGPLTVRQFRSGHSNLTYFLRVGENELVLRRPPRGKEIKTAHDMEREFRILSRLEGLYPKIPRPLAYCEDRDVLGVPFYVMERVKGIILRGKEPPMELNLPGETMNRLCLSAVDNLATLHGVDIRSSGLSDLGKPEGYVARQVKGWTERYFNAKTDELPKVEEAAQWLEEAMPGEKGASLIHNDYKFDNLVLDPGDLANILAVLDWEMATVGDPFMDLGTSLGYWVDPADSDSVKMLPFGPTLVEGNLNRAQVVERYSERSRLSVDSPVFYYVYGLFKVAVIAQQIYKRYKEGFSKDPRFAMMIMGVQILGDQAVLAIEKNRIYDLG